MSLIRVFAEIAVLVVACFLSFVIGVGIAVHHVRGTALSEIEAKKVEEQKPI